ncbi:MAG TPA: dTMP kinase [Candidatus Cloacimonadota bacterium]|nr:dTMP kinase [Candidatus Cloacimonadota bacterium]
MKGLFVTFEGIEGSGKSTQMKMLAEKLEELGRPLLLTREPGGPPIAESIRALLLDPGNKEMLRETELLLYSASRAQHTGQWILPALRQGKIVLCDRYYDSTIAYQGAARNQNLDFIAVLTRFSTFNTVPDITFLLDLPVEEGFARIGHRKLDRLEQEDRSFHERVRQQYLLLAKEQPGRFVVLDATLPPQELHKLIINQVLTHTGVSSER